MSVYRFPKDLEQHQRWIASLPNANFIYTDNKRICQLHFPKTAKTKMVKGHMIFDEPPSIFKDIPPSCIPKVPHKRNASAITSTARNSLPDQLEEFQALDKLVVCVSRSKKSYDVAIHPPSATNDQQSGQDS